MPASHYYVSKPKQKRPSYIKQKQPTASFEKAAAAFGLVWEQAACFYYNNVRKGMRSPLKAKKVTQKMFGGLRKMKRLWGKG
jgi:hypothetical protein